MNLFILLTTILFFSFVANGKLLGDFETHLTVDADPVTIPNPIVLSVKLRYPAGYAPDLMTIKGNLAQQINPLFPRYRVIKEMIERPESIDDTHFIQTLSYTIEPLTLGSLSFSLLDIPFLPTEEKDKIKAHLIFSEVLTVRVDPASPLSSDPEEIGSAAPLLHLKPGLPLSLTLSNREKFLTDPTLLAQEAIRNQTIFSQRSFPWVYLFLLVGLAILFAAAKQLRAYMAWKKQQRVAIDPQQKASEGVAKIQIKEGREAYFYSNLIEILRTYIKEIFLINAHEQTTEEFLSLTRQTPFFSPTMSRLLARVFYTGDLVKFGHYKPSKQECEEALEAAKKIINEAEPGAGNKHR